jgi:hypothetical protein
MSFVSNVLSSGNVGVINTVDISANLTVDNCTFSVNGTSAVVPQSIISHLGGKISITQSTFNNISLGVQALLTFYGFCYFNLLLLY